MFVLQLVMVIVAGVLSAKWGIYGWRYAIVVSLIYSAGVIVGLTVCK